MCSRWFGGRHSLRAAEHPAARTNDSQEPFSDLSVDFAGESAFQAGPGGVLQHDQSVEFVTRQIIGTRTFLLRRTGIRYHPQQILGAREPLLLLAGEVVPASAHRLC